jgi:dihydrofolate reductase
MVRNVSAIWRQERNHHFLSAHSGVLLICYTECMRKIFLFMMVSLDGYYEGKGHDLSWHNVDEEFVNFADQQLDEADTLVFGRKTYEMMADYWPNESTEDSTAARMNSLHKVVFSHTPLKVEWENAVPSTDLIAKINELKSQSGKDIAVLGSSHLGREMLEAGLLDEVRIMINPVFIGNGSTLFEGLSKNLQLTSSRTFKNGNVLLSYTTV